MESLKDDDLYDVDKDMAQTLGCWKGRQWRKARRIERESLAYLKKKITEDGLFETWKYLLSNDADVDQRCATSCGSF